jgi:hypothetical protein
MRIAISAALHEMDREVSVVTLAPADVSRLAAERSELWDEFLQGAVVLVGLDAPTMMEQLTVVAPSPAQ